VREWVHQAFVWFMHVTLVIFSWISAVVPAWLLRWAGNARSGTVTLEILYGVIRLQFSLPTAPPQADEDDDDEDALLDAAHGLDRSAARLFQRDDQTAAHSETTAHVPLPQNDISFGELRRVVQRLEVKVSSIQTTLTDTQSGVASLEGVVGGLHYLVEQHDAALQELQSATS
jgi:hypothetical protein